MLGDAHRPGDDHPVCGEVALCQFINIRAIEPRGIQNFPFVKGC